MAFSLSQEPSSSQSYVKYLVPNSRPEWYIRFFIPVEGSGDKRHRCVECDFVGMAVPYALTNLLRHFSASKHKACGSKYSEWRIKQESAKSSSKTNSQGKRYAQINSHLTPRKLTRNSEI